MQFAKKKINIFFLLVALWPGFLFDWLLEWGLVFGMTAYGVYQYVHLRQKTTLRHFGFLLAIYLLIIGLFSYLLTQLSQRFFTSPRDLLDLLKPIFLYFSCLLPFTLEKKKRAYILNGASIVLIYSVICFIFLRLEIPVISNLLASFYSGTKTQISDFSIRLTIPFENPNFLGMFSVLCLYIGLNLSSKINLSLTLPAFMCVCLSGSRTAWALGVFSIFVFILEALLTSCSRKSRLSMPILAVLLAIIAAIVVFLWNFSESYQRLSDFIDIFANFDLERDQSYADRIALRDGSMRLILERFFWGWGAIKESGYDVVDNQYYGIALRYGISGLFLIMLYFSLAFTLHLRTLSVLREKIHLLIFYLILFTWLWTGSYLENIRLVVLIVMLLYSIGTDRGKN